jgi:hypothetical protein
MLGSRDEEDITMDAGCPRFTTAIALVAAVFFAQKSSALAQSKSELTVENYSCRDLLRESGTERDVAIAFMHGYILGKSGAPAFDVDALRKQSAVFIERCLDNPQARALDTMVKARADAPAAPRKP